MPRILKFPKLCAASIAALICMSPSSAEQDGDTKWIDLTDDLSRAQLGEYEMRKFAPPGQKAARYNFNFTADSSDGIYGIDVSHHNGAVDWQAVKTAGVKFVYMKATQGVGFRDNTFLANWAAIGQVGGVRRGAYHFLSAGVSGVDQAKSFLALMNKVGVLGDSDVTPVLDMEWDMTKQNSSQVDKWAAYSDVQIAKIASDWLETVQQATGRLPMIYTTRSWWQQRLKNNTSLQKYPQWVNDFRTASYRNGAPLTVPGHNYVTWQFTDAGLLAAGSKKFDVNRLRHADLEMLSGKAR